VAESVLRDAGYEVRDLRCVSQPAEHPDLEATIDGEFSAIEVTELVHKETLEKSIHGDFCYFVWDRSSLIEALQETISKKDRVSVSLRYKRFILIIATDEFTLNETDVDKFIRGHKFCARSLTNVYFGLSYHPDVNGEGRCPVFDLQLCTDEP
jgi:hypothetical protein